LLLLTEEEEEKEQQKKREERSVPRGSGEEDAHGVAVVSPSPTSSETATFTP
jgi:hypothetical protein